MINPKICICGAGTMGAGIAQAAAQAGMDSILYDIRDTVLKNAKISIDNNLRSLVLKKRITAAENTSILQKILFTHNIRDCQAGIIIEAIAERTDAKISLFNDLALINTEKTIFATNTSSLSVSAIAADIPHPERVIGMHFFNPATLMKLVEIVRTADTNEYTLNMVSALANQMGKQAVICNDVPGFIVNRVARPFYLEAFRIVEKGIADFETVDLLMESAGFKMGPFRLMDMIGNDINHSVSASLYDALKQPNRLRPSGWQETKVKNGELGRKTDKGFYKYSA